MNTQTYRRDFLKAAVVVAGFPSIVPSTVLGKKKKKTTTKLPPSERANLGIISCGNRAKVTKVYEQYEKSEVVAVCDPIKDRRDKKLKMHPNAEAYSDFRDLLARKDVDAVHIATSDHWHVPISLAAARAGKDVYCEKPLGLTIEQDLAAREIVDKHDRIFQYGTQQRSSMHLRLGIELALNGHIGDVKEVYVWAPHGLSGGSATPVLPVPTGYDLELWTGPAPVAPFSHDRNLQQGNRNAIFHVYDHAIGFIAGWGAHPMDQAQWWADAAGLDIPVEYHGKGTIPTEGLFNTLTNWDIESTYANGIKMYFMDDQTARTPGRVPNLEKVKKFGNCTMFVGTKGWVAVSRQGWVVSSEEIRQRAKDPGPVRLQVTSKRLCGCRAIAPAAGGHAALRRQVRHYLPTRRHLHPHRRNRPLGSEKGDRSRQCRRRRHDEPQNAQAVGVVERYVVPPLGGIRCGQTA